MSLVGSGGICGVILDSREGSLGMGGTWGRVILFFFSSWLKEFRHTGTQGMRMRQAFNASHLKGTESRMAQSLWVSEKFIHSLIH